ncbi:MAG TPA: hypothetical protein PKY63_09135 [Bacteroidales bacterium]|nr:hypothetical protein [Bacteroidales bacterium]
MINKESIKIRENMLSETYDRCFTSMVKNFCDNSDNANTKYYAFYPSFGVKKNQPLDFLVYGQAVNGWHDDSAFLVSDKKSTIGVCKKSKEYSNSYFPYDNHGPLDWVNVQWCKSEYDKFLRQSKAEAEFKRYYIDKYRAYSSFFWNVVYKTVSDKMNYSRETRSWADSVVWSNLYKISPHKGNPNGKERGLQIKYAIQLVKMELDELKPNYCLVLTNLKWWDPFAKELRLEICSQKETKRIQQVAYYGNTKIIVTKRPFLGDSEAYSREILNSITK